MDFFDQITQFIEFITKNPYALITVITYVLSYWMKNYVPINNKLIPTINFLLGGVLGIVLIEKTLVGAILGVVCAYFAIAFYEHIKNTLEYIATRKGGDHDDLQEE